MATTDLMSRWEHQIPKMLPERQNRPHEVILYSEAFPNLEDRKLPLRTVHEIRLGEKTEFDKDFSLFNFTGHRPSMRWWK